MLKGLLAVSVGLNILLAAVIYQRARNMAVVKGDYLVNVQGRFTIMTKREPPKDRFVVVFDDGRFHWTIESNMLSMNVGSDQSFTLHLGLSGQYIERTLLELKNEDAAKVFVTDLNADGIPEQRRTGTATEVFLGGNFYPSTMVDGKRVVIKDGRQFEVAFDGKGWTLKK